MERGSKVKKSVRILLLVLLLAIVAPAGFAEASHHTREDVRAAWRSISDWHDASPYEAAPSIAAPYAPGALTPDSRADALNMLNFLRWLAELSPVSESSIYDFQCQHAAVLLAALDYVDHNAPRPEDMDGNFYDSAHLGTTSGNIARFNWMRDSIIREGVAYFARDDGDGNLDVLGHRRWVLNPRMAATGFGLANSTSGMSYVVMYAHDLGNPAAEWDWVGWPAAGAFPAELLHEALAWSVSLNPERYDLAASMPSVTLSEEASGLSFSFRPDLGVGDGFCAVSLEPFGSGACLIFRPDFTGTGFTDYQQNQRWTVRIDGLVAPDGGEAFLEYTANMICLHVQDPVNIEISRPEAALVPGERVALAAQVIPAYADDLSVTWTSSDPSVAVVDANGAVTAVAQGSCMITCADCMGHTDTCAVTVAE